MASAGLLLLLLVSSTLHMSTVSTSSPAQPDQKSLGEISLQHQQRGLPGFIRNKRVDKGVQMGAEILQKILMNAVPVAALVGATPAGFAATALLGAFVFALSMVTDQPDMTENKFEKLNSALHKYQIENKWETWAASVYHVPERDINIAWDKFTQMILSVHETEDENKKNRIMTEFHDTYKQHFQNAIWDLHYYLTVNGVSFSSKLGDMLGKHVNCHEKDIKAFADLINMLMYKGNVMHQFYNVFMDIESDVKFNTQVEMAYQAYSIMSEIYKDCVSRSMVYIQQDVQKIIGEHKGSDYQKLANNVYSYLKDHYDEYDWMVVAYSSSKFSNPSFVHLNRHSLAGFTDVPQEPERAITVSVARQVSGPNNNIKKIKDAIDKCLEQDVQCCEVARKLRGCGVDVGGGPYGHIPLMHTLTAIHAFRYEGDQCYKATEKKTMTPPATQSPQTPHIHTGSCKSSFASGGQYVIMIKSEEEIKKQDPCTLLDCGAGNTCVRIEGVFRAMCKCNYPYYGEKCDRNIEEDKKKLKETRPEHILNTS